MTMHLTKFIAQSGYCSRRQAEELIRKKNVKVNGKIAELGQMVSENDIVEIGRQKLELPKEKIYIKLNKPIGYTCTNRKFPGEKNIFELVNIKERLFVVGRLDKDSHGLVILTNNGDWAQKITHPKYEHEKKYIVKIQNLNRKSQNYGLIQSKFKEGLDIGENDGVVKVKKIEYIGNDLFEIILIEGKKRQIRRMFKKLGYEVEDLLRIGIGKIELNNLGDGVWQKILSEEIN